MIRDPITGERALLGTTRSERPNEYAHGPAERCAFCPGNEDLTPPEIARVGTAQRWEARAFLNKYPAIVSPHGEHEVIVDSPDHAAEITLAGLDLWRDRYRAALERMPRSYPVLFKNSGAAAGATIVHPHTQLVVLPERPDRWERIERASDACAWCVERENAVAHDTVVVEGDGVTAFVRERSRFSTTLAILPERCAPSIDRASDASWRAAGALAASAVEALKRSAGPSAAFNVLLYSDPHAGAASFHWWLEVVPRVSTLAGFELSTGMFIRGATAQESAARWRRMIAPPDGSL